MKNVKNSNNNKNKIRCLKCGFFRPDDTIAPEWQCPNCHVAYEKIEKYENRIKQIDLEREKARVLGLFDYFFLILFSVALFFAFSPILNTFGSIIVYLMKTITISGLIFIIISPVIALFIFIYFLTLTIIPFILGMITRSLIKNKKTSHRSMSIEEFIVVCVLMVGGNIFVNGNAMFVSIIQALITCTFVFIFAQKSTKLNSSFLKGGRPKFKIGSKIIKK